MVNLPDVGSCRTHAVAQCLRISSVGMVEERSFRVGDTTIF